MVRRSQLTPQLVYEAKCPDRGEIWIADTKIKGFGLRLWSTKSGGEKAFAIRVADKKSKIVRRTFDTNQAWRTNLHLRYSVRENQFDLGEYLEEAREWARDEIDRVKGNTTIAQERDRGRKVVINSFKELTFERAASAFIDGLKVSGASQRYLDRLDKLFSAQIPQKLKQTPLSKLKAKQIAKAIVNPEIPTGNVRILRSFISQIIARGAAFDGRLGLFHDKFAKEFSVQWERVRDVRFPELRNFPRERYAQIFSALEADEENWQQALAIRLYFEFHAPLTRILSGNWKQIYDEHWYPYLPTDRKLWFECRENLSEDTQRLLGRIRLLGEREFCQSNFWFASRFARQVDHIRVVEPAWQRALRRCDIRYYPLREFSRSYREFHNPSYLVSFIRQYGELIREIQNAAEVSKSLTAAINNK